LRKRDILGVSSLQRAASDVWITAPKFCGKFLNGFDGVRHGLIIEWADLLRDFDHLPEATIEKDGKARASRPETRCGAGRSKVTHRWRKPDFELPVPLASLPSDGRK